MKERERTPLEQRADAAGWDIEEWRYVARLIIEKGMKRDDAIKLMLDGPEEPK